MLKPQKADFIGHIGQPRKTLATGYRISAVGRIKRTLSTSLLWMGEEKNEWARKEAEVIPQPMRNPEGKV